MRYLSVCSGIEAATCAWHPLGWQPWAFAEVEAFPSAVLSHHYPSVPNLGDMTKFKDWPDATLDLLVGGTPCQSFSVAGLRKGLADPRGNLMLTFGAIAGRYRPRWLVWENVTGVLSSNKGRDFGAFLGMLGELGYGFAYRVLDAQFFGVPQRRRRVFVVGHLGDWRRAAAVLFERHSLSGNPAPRRKAGEDASQAVAECLRAGGNRTGGDRPPGTDADTAATYLIPVAFAQNSRDEVRMFGGDGRTVGALSAEPGMKQQSYVAFPANLSATQCASAIDLSPSLGAKNPTAVASAMAVRRLTPRECERLQGFPDDYTLIQYRGKPASDGPRYKALGNSMAVPCMRWIGERIAAVDAIPERAVAA